MSVNIEVLKENGFQVASIYGEQIEGDAVAIKLPQTFKEAQELTKLLQPTNVLSGYMLGFDPRTKEWIIHPLDASEEELEAEPVDKFYSGDALIANSDGLQSPFLVQLGKDKDFVSSLLDTTLGASISIQSAHKGKWVVLAREKENKNSMLGFLSSDADHDIEYDEWLFNSVATVLDADNADYFDSKYDAKNYVGELLFASDIEEVNGTELEDIKFTYLKIK